MKFRILIVVGSIIGIVVGLVPPFNVFSIVSGVVCLYLGITGSNEEQDHGPKNGDKEGPF